MIVTITNMFMSIAIAIWTKEWDLLKLDNFGLQLFSCISSIGIVQLEFFT